MKQMKKQDGFTLIELVVVVAILGILAAVLTPRVLDAMSNARNNGAEATGKSIQLAMERYLIEEGNYPTVAEFDNTSKGTAAGTVEAAELADLLGKFATLTAGQFTGAVTYTTTNGYSLTVTLTDSNNSVTITPGSVTVN